MWLCLPRIWVHFPGPEVESLCPCWLSVCWVRENLSLPQEPCLCLSWPCPPTPLQPSALQRPPPPPTATWALCNSLLDLHCFPCGLFPDCEVPLKKEGGLPEGPVLEALLCAETGEKKVELKEEETIMDCQVGAPTLAAGPLSPCHLSPLGLPALNHLAP